MKFSTTAVLLASLSAAQAVPLPTGLLPNVQDECSFSGTNCGQTETGKFLHHLVDSDVKYTHLIHPQTGQLIPINHTHTASTTTTPQQEGEEGEEEAGGAGQSSSTLQSTPAAAGMYASSNHPPTPNPFKGASGSVLGSSSGNGSSGQLTLDPSTTNPSPASAPGPSGGAASSSSSMLPSKTGNSTSTPGGLDVNLMAPVNETDSTKKPSDPSPASNNNDANKAPAPTKDGSVPKSPIAQVQGKSFTPGGPIADQQAGKGTSTNPPPPAPPADPKDGDAKAPDATASAVKASDVKGSDAATSNAITPDAKAPDAKDNDGSAADKSTTPTVGDNIPDAKAKDGAAASPVDDKTAKKTPTPPLAPGSNVTVADATGVAHAPGLVGSPDGALSHHKNVLLPLFTVAVAAAGAVFLL